MTPENPTIYCPHCGTSMTAQLGQLGQRLRQAIMLQSSRVGTEFVCQQCRQGFIYTRVDMPTVTFGQAQPATQKVG